MNLTKILAGVVGVLVVGVGAYFLLTKPVDEDASQAQAEAMSKVEGKAETKKRPLNNEAMVYETPADSVDECSSYEDYDEEAGVCFYECENEVQCKEIDNAINAELDNWTDEMAKDTEPRKEEPLSEDDVKMSATYSVSSGEKIAFKTGKDSEEFRKIWDEIAALSPNNISDKYIESYELFDDANNDTLAFVDDADENGKWRIAVNVGARKNESLREQKATLVHELGHIITLNRSQVVKANSCPNLDLAEGCANANSYVNTFYNKYWKGVKAPATFSASKFVTEYAATEPVEDLAESFAFFVMEKDQDKLGNEVKDQKIKHFYQFPDLVAIRAEMREALGRDIVRERKLAN